MPKGNTHPRCTSSSKHYRSHEKTTSTFALEQIAISTKHCPSKTSPPIPSLSSKSLLVVATPEPSRILRHALRTTSELINSSRPVLATLPSPAAVRILLHGFPLEGSAGNNLDIAAGPDVAVGLGSVGVGVERYGFGEVPVAELGDGADDVDAVAPGGADLDGEGERDGFGVGAGWVGGGDGEFGRGVEVAVSGGVDVVGVLEGVDGAVGLGWGRGVGDLVAFGDGDHLGRGFVAGEGMLVEGDLDFKQQRVATNMVSVKFCFRAIEKSPMVKRGESWKVMSLS